MKEVNVNDWSLFEDPRTGTGPRTGGSPPPSSSGDALMQYCRSINMYNQLPGLGLS